MDDREASVRASVRRGAILYALLFVADALVFYLILVNRQSPGAFFSLFLVGAVGLLLGYQFVQYARDVGAPLAESEGIVTRKWQRAELLIAWQSYYVTIERTVFRVRPEDYLELTEGRLVKVVHLPHTLNIVSIHQAPGNSRPIERE